ncbi:hypothetical protein EMCRGX_G016270 [Ephydatia muelleri]
MKKPWHLFKRLPVNVLQENPAHTSALLHALVTITSMHVFGPQEALSDEMSKDKDLPVTSYPSFLFSSTYHYVYSFPLLLNLFHDVCSDGLVLTQNSYTSSASLHSQLQIIDTARIFEEPNDLHEDPLGYMEPRHLYLCIAAVRGNGCGRR